MNNSLWVPVLQFLSFGIIAFFSFAGVASWANARRREREAYYKSDTLKKIAEVEGSAAISVIEFLREEARHAARRRQEGLKLGGLVTAAAGVGVFVFLRGFLVIRDQPLHLVGLIPLLIGVALLVYAYLLAPKSQDPGKGASSDKDGRK